jgi:hypothetical protein
MLWRSQADPYGIDVSNFHSRSSYGQQKSSGFLHPLDRFALSEALRMGDKNRDLSRRYLGITTDATR